MMQSTRESYASVLVFWRETQTRLGRDGDGRVATSGIPLSTKTKGGLEDMAQRRSRGEGQTTDVSIGRYGGALTLWCRGSAASP